VATVKRSTAELRQNRADLLAALQEAERPIRAPALVAAAYGYTLDTIPDRVLHVVWSRSCTDLRALALAGHLVMDGSGHVWTYTRVDLPGSDLGEQRATNDAMRADVADLHRQVDGWEVAD
jgi:hypothetical protein